MSGGAERGVFITFEGGEGVGKSTQIASLAKRFRANGRRVLVTREPGGTAGAEAARQVVLSGAAKGLGPNAEAFLFAAARADNVINLIRPALARGEIVLCDRFMDSSRVYQGVGSGVPDELLSSLERAVTEGARPDMTIMFDLDPATGLARASQTWEGQGPDRYESDDLAAHEARRQGFLAIARREPERCAVVDAAKSQSAVEAQLVDVITARLPQLATAL